MSFFKKNGMKKIRSIFLSILGLALVSCGEVDINLPIDSNMQISITNSVMQGDKIANSQLAKAFLKKQEQAIVLENSRKVTGIESLVETNNQQALPLEETNPKQSESVQKALQDSTLLLTSANSLSNIDNYHQNFPVKSELRPNVSQQFLGTNEIEQRLMEALPEIEYHTNDLSEFAQEVNRANWFEGVPLNSATATKIQALLNWHNHSVGAVDGKFSKNTIKAMQAFQKARGIKPTSTMNAITWDFLTKETEMTQRPVLVQYKLKQEDVTIPRYYRKSQYKSVREGIAEKFHMSRAMLNRLNPNIKLKAGNTITVYNPGQPNSRLVHRVVIYKKKNLLVAYDENDVVIASYPTTVGFKSPSGSYKVANRVLNPSYNSDFKNKANTIPPGPNNPVGLVWMGLSKPSFGIHGSPMPEMISRQRSHGCVRLTNWDALSLYGVMKHGAKVDFKNS
ncbi:MAG: murein L,D-transpeptidase [Moraxellaceae bacterium]|nr:murein L,D-transpeptidase [Moraxellaceae bacterium]